MSYTHIIEKERYVISHMPYGRFPSGSNMASKLDRLHISILREIEVPYFSYFSKRLDTMPTPTSFPFYLPAIFHIVRIFKSNKLL
jgi:hypothetical protein